MPAAGSVKSLLMGLPAVKFCFNQSSDEMGHHVRSAVSQSEDDFSGVVHVYKPFRAGLPHPIPAIDNIFRQFRRHITSGLLKRS